MGGFCLGSSLFPILYCTRRFDAGKTGFVARTRVAKATIPLVARSFAADLVNDIEELCVRKETTLANALVLDSSKDGGTSRFGDLKTEFFGFQKNTVEPTLLS